MWTWQPYRKQLLIIILLTVLISTNLYIIRSLCAQPTQPQAPLTEDVIRREQALAYERYRQRSTTDTAEIQTNAAAAETQKAELIFSGLADAGIVRAVLDALRNTNQRATFFVSEADASFFPECLQLIVNAGYPIGVREDPEVLPLADQSVEEMINTLTSLELQIKQATGAWPTTLLYTGETLPHELPRCAVACGYFKIVRPSAYFTVDGTPASQQVTTLLSSLHRGTLLCVNIDNGNQWLSVAFPILMRALEDTDLTAKAQALYKQNAGNRSDIITRIFTTEKSVAFTFSGFGNDVELRYVLSTLAERSGKAVFFLTPKNLLTNAHEINEVLAAQQPLGIALTSAQYPTVQQAVLAILAMQETLADQYGYQEMLPLRAMYGTASDVLREAASATGLPLVSALLTPVRPEDIRMTNADSVVTDLSNRDKGSSLQRGEIVHFQMNQYQKSNTLLGNLVKAIASEKTSYDLGSLPQMLNNSTAVYTYPLTNDVILPSLLNKIHPGQLQGDMLKAIQKRYIGNPYYNVTIKMPGFTAVEIKTLDNSGIIPNDQNYIFLTFDDWGTDQKINRLLDVLKRHGATATFFIRTNNVHYNPNLLRAIALDGHTVGSHTNMHLPLSNITDNIRDNAKSLTAEQVATLKLDFVSSWDTLEHVIGDVVVNGKPALTTLFRPPTLAVSKEGMAAVLDCGYSYVVSGSLTTQDYNATSAEALCRLLLKNTKSGAIFIMHMTDTSKFTVDAVDLYLTALEARTDAKYQPRGLNVIIQ